MSGIHGAQELYVDLCFLVATLSYSPQALTLDIIMNLPRLTFSMCQLDVMHWLLKANSASQVPSSKIIHAHNATLPNMCGVHTLQYTGAFGNTFCVNSLADIISQVRRADLIDIYVLHSS